MFYAFITDGIIPTRMGTRYMRIKNYIVCKDHPHAYGDKCDILAKDGATVGSSPRVWGQGRATRTRADACRIIPTRMGTRTKSLMLITVLLDHPHAYGDKFFASHGCVVSQGSSPRVWGQASSLKKTHAPCGIIPTRMGTRLKKSRKIAVLQNQPLRFPLTFHRSFV